MKNRYDDVQLMGPICINNEVIPDLVGSRPNETQDIADFAKTLMSPTSCEIPTGLELVENAHLMHDINERQPGIDSSVPENHYDDIQLTGLNHTDDQVMLDRVRPPDNEITYFVSSSEIPNTAWYVHLSATFYDLDNIDHI